jgi:signal transduction histidine kinase
MFTGLPKWVGKLAGILLLAAVYFAAGKLGLSLAFENRSASLVWPPTGIALASVLLLGQWIWPGIFLGAFSVNFDTTGLIASSLGIATGNTLEALLAAWLIGKFAGGARVFDDPWGVFQFLLWAGIGCIAGATIGVSNLGLSAEMPWDKFAGTWWTWWQGDIIAALLVTPPLILWRMDWRVRWTPKQAAWAAFLFGLVVSAGMLVFGDKVPIVNRDYPLVFIFVPLLIWIAFQFGRREAATATLILAAIAIQGTLQDLGPFKNASHHVSLLILQTFLGISGVTTLLFASLAHGLKQNKTELELRVLERTAKLRQSERLAAIGEMITGLAHESRNALQRTHACLELLTLKIEQRPDLLALVQDIQKAQDYLVHLYDEVRAYAAPLKLRKEKIDLSRLMQETWEHLEPERKGRAVTLESADGCAGLDFRGDPLALNQVFRNILENSLSICADPVRLQVHWTLKTFNGRQAAQISIRDNGPGFAERLHEKVFEPFFSTKIQGTGLGLAIAKRIVEAHGGTIQVGRNGHPGAEILLTFYQEKP